MQFEASHIYAVDSEQKPDFTPTILGPEEQLYMEELKERHELAPERNTLDYTKFMIKYQIEYLREEVADRLII